MTENELRDLLNRLSDGDLEIDEVLSRLKSGPFKSEASTLFHPDHHRRLRQGLAEVVYAQSKTTEQILEIASQLQAGNYPVLFTRLLDEHAEALQREYTEGRFNEQGNTFIINAPQPKNSQCGEPYIALISAGTSDLYVIEEAAEVCVAMDTAFEKRNDVGVAGLHRLMHHLELIQNATAIVVAAGMEGALPSVVGGLASSPVFAVPTSVGYGASFKGLAALLAMLNSCAPGVSVVNIDNGFSAAFAACQVARQVKKNK